MQRLLYPDQVEVLPMAEDEVPVQCRLGHLGRMPRNTLQAMGEVLDPTSGAPTLIHTDKCPACLEGERELLMCQMPQTD